MEIASVWTSYWLYFAAIAAIVTVLIIALTLRYRSKSAVALRAMIEAQIAREADELDLDKRLGPLEYVEIEAASGKKLKIAVRRSGAETGPEILCIHGIGASMIIYRRLAPHLADTYRVTCIDLPGFGMSDKPRSFLYTLDEQAENLTRAVDALKLVKPLAVVSSMGGSIALAAATKKGDMFRGIVALSPAVDPSRIPVALLPLAQYGEMLHRLNPQLTVQTVVRTVVGQVIARRELITPSLVSLYFEPFKGNSLAGASFMKAFNLLADRRMPALFSKLETPLLIIRGLRDKLVKQAACEDLKRIVAHSTLITHPSAGHHIMEDEPEFIAAEVRKFDGNLV